MTSPNTARVELFRAIVSRLHKHTSVLVALLDLTDPAAIPPLLISSRLHRLTRELEQLETGGGL